MFFTSLAATTISNGAKKENGNVSPEHHEINKIALTIMLLVFILEMAMFVWSVILAIKCGKKHEDLFIHIVFAFFFPFFYILYYYISGCSHYKGVGCESGGEIEA